MVNIIRGGDVVIHRPFFFLLEEVEGTAGACVCMWITTESRGVTVIVTVLSSSVALPHGRKTKACRLSVTIVANNLARVRKTQVERRAVDREMQLIAEREDDHRGNEEDRHAAERLCRLGRLA